MTIHEEKVKELVEQYPPDNHYDYPMVQIPAKDLETEISSLLLHQREQLAGEVEKMKREIIVRPEAVAPIALDYENHGYNSALSAVLTLIRK